MQMAEQINLYENKNEIFTDALERVVMELYMRKERDGLKTLAFCGSEPGVGTTSIAIDVAIFMAKSGWKTLLVDADLHKKISYKALSSKSSLGLADFLEREVPVEQLVLETNEPMLAFMPSGVAKGRPLALFCSERMNQLITVLNQRYDYIIFDSPALSLSTDTCILAAKTDGVVLITAYGSSNVKVLRSNVDTLKRYQIPLLGVIMNKSDKELYRSYKKDYDYFNKMRYLKNAKQPAVSKQGGKEQK